MIQEYIITGDGYYNTKVASPVSLREIGDIKWQRGVIRFKGTEEQLDAFLDTLIQDETYFKYRSCFTKEEYDNLERIFLL
jgi:alpha-amylase/alpha-mannosidase (GH57 family)